MYYVLYCILLYYVFYLYYVLSYPGTDGYVGLSQGGLQRSQSLGGKFSHLKLPRPVEFISERGDFDGSTYGTA